MGVFPPFSVEIFGLASPQAQTRPPLGKEHGGAGTKGWPLTERGPSSSPASPEPARGRGGGAQVTRLPHDGPRTREGVVERGHRAPAPTSGQIHKRTVPLGRSCRCDLL